MSVNPVWKLTPNTAWKGDRNLGAWAFTEKEDKPSYNEGDHIATYRNPVWSTEEGSNVPITPTHNPCGYWIRDYTPPEPALEVDPYLVVWYKFNEGSGLVVHNYAEDGSLGGGLFPDLTVWQGVGSFWSYLAGFGSTSQHWWGAGGALVDAAYNNPGKVIGGVAGSCMGIFLNKNFFGNPTASGYPVGPWGLAGEAWIAVQDQVFQPWTIRWGNQPSLSMTFDPGLNNVWLFHFIRNDGRYCLVKPDGTLVESPIIGGLFDLTKTVVFTQLYMGVANFDALFPPPSLGYYAAGTSYGDFIIYSNKILTQTEWAVWYDRLRSRYGMAARSGW